MLKNSLEYYTGKYFDKALACPVCCCCPIRRHHKSLSTAPHTS